MFYTLIFGIFVYAILSFPISILFHISYLATGVETPNPIWF